MARLRLIKSDKKKEKREDDSGGQMSFLEHLDELRTRLIRSIVFVVLAASVCLVCFRLHLQFPGAANQSRTR